MAFLTSVITTGVAAVCAGALAVPALRPKVIGDVDRDWIAGELDMDSIDPDGVTVRLKSGGFFRVYRVRGASYDAAIEQHQTAMLKGRANLLHAIGSRKAGVRLFGIKRRRDISFEADWPSPALTEIGEAERDLFKSGSFLSWFFIVSSRSMKVLQDIDEQIRSTSKEYEPDPVRQAEHPDDPCPLTGFLNYLVTGEMREDLVAVSEAISGNLPATDFQVDRDTGVIRTFTPLEHLNRVIAVRRWPESVDGQLIGDLLALDCDIEVSQACEPWAQDQAILLYKRKQVEQGNSLIGNPTVSAECIALVDLLSSGNVTIFHSQLQVVVRARTEAELDRITEAACEVLGRRRISYSVEAEGAGLCWFNRIPGPIARRFGTSNGLYRPLTLRDENIGALWAWHHAATGMQESPLGSRPIRYLRTPSGSPYALQLHVSARKGSPGNFLVIAPTGSGKSTLLLHLLGGLAKFPGVRSYIFDSKEGARFMVEALGGKYQGYDELELNPLDVGADTPKARHRVYSILKAMAGTVTEEDEAALAHAVSVAFSIAPPERTLSAIFPFAFEKRTALRRAFAKWVVDEKGNKGLHSHVFNAGHDSLSGILGSSHMVGINMNEALEDPVLGPPVVAHVATAIGQAAARHSNGFVIFIDEAAKLLQNDGFRALAVEMFREYRKLGGSVGLAFQDPAALFRSGSAEAFLENTSTFFFYPNRLANEKSLEPFNLNDEQLDFVIGGGGAKRRGRRVLVVKRDAATGFDESTIVDVDLTPLGSPLRFYQAGVEANKTLETLKAKWGDEWIRHIPEIEK